MKLAIFPLSLILIIAFYVSAFAQEQKPVVEISIVVHPPELPDGTKLPMTEAERSSVEQTVLGNMRTTVGALFSAERFDSDIKRLMRLRKYTLSASTSPKGEGVAIKLDIHLLPLVKEVEFKDPQETNLSVSDEVRWRLSAQTGEFLNPHLLDYDTEELADHFRKQGYPLAKAIYKLSPSADGVTVTYIVDLGPFVVVSDILFEGNESYESDVLYSKIESRVRTFLRSIFGGGYFIESQIKSDALALKKFYYSEGYLDVKVTAKTDESGFKDGIAKVKFSIQEGKRYKVRTVVLDGVSKLPINRVSQKIETKAGDFVRKESIDADTERILKLYYEAGYITARVDTSYRVLEEEGFIDLVFRVYEGEQIRLRRIVIQGNWRTRDKVIRRELTISSGELCDLNRLRESFNRVLRLRYFSEIGVDFVDTDAPNLKDLVIQVKEARCGQFQMGFSYGDLGFQGKFLLIHPNFDPFDLPTSFSEAFLGFFEGRRLVGGGYIFKIELSPGRTHSSYGFNIVDPYLFDTKYRLTIGPQYQKDIWSEWTQEEASLNLGIGRYLSKDSFVEIFARPRRITTTDIPSYAALDVFDIEGTLDLYSLSFSFVLDKRNVDKHSKSYKGFKIRAETAYTGGFLGGDWSYSKHSLTANGYLPLYADLLERHIILSSRFIAGYAEPHSGSPSVPIFDRFFAGGSMLRGFEYRGIGPTEGKSHIGGSVLTILSTELSIPLPTGTDNFRFAIFLDAGNLASSWDSYYLNDTRISAGFGLRIQPQPFFSINLDFAWPLRRLSSDETRNFHFFFDTSF